MNDPYIQLYKTFLEAQSCPQYSVNLIDQVKCDYFYVCWRLVQTHNQHHPRLSCQTF